MSVNLSTKIVTTTPYNVLNTDQVIFINITSGPASVVLPSTGNATGEDCCGDESNDKKYESSKSTVLKRSFYIKDFSGTAVTNPITITSAGGKTIDGGSFALINGGYAHIQVVYDGTNWKIIS
jgi:hypothetical protein